jgi:hypothetical protein
MKLSEMTDKEFFKMYEAYEDEMAQDFLENSLPVIVEKDFLEIIYGFIDLRHSIKDVELKKLKVEAGKKFKNLKETQFERICEEIKCFKDITSLHKKLIEKNDFY